MGASWGNSSGGRSLPEKNVCLSWLHWDFFTLELQVHYLQEPNAVKLSFLLNFVLLFLYCICSYLPFIPFGWSPSYLFTLLVFPHPPIFRLVKVLLPQPLPNTWALSRQLRLRKLPDPIDQGQSCSLVPPCASFLWPETSVTNFPQSIKSWIKELKSPGLQSSSSFQWC